MNSSLFSDAPCPNSNEEIGYNAIIKINLCCYFKLKRQRGGRFQTVSVGHVNDKATERNEGQIRNKSRQEIKC